MGDFGASLRFGQPAMSLVLDASRHCRTPAATMALALLFGIPAGVVAAVWRGTSTDVSIRLVTLLGQAVPSFFLGVVAIIVFAVWLRWLPTGGRGSFGQLILPAATLAFNLVALIARVTRSCMLDVLKQDYVRTARAKGVSETKVVGSRSAQRVHSRSHGDRFAGGLLLGGVVVTETIFSWPGVGRLAIQAIYARDFPVVQAVVFVFAVIFVVVNLIVDLLYAVLDPRIGYR